MKALTPLNKFKIMNKSYQKKFGAYFRTSIIRWFFWLSRILIPQVINNGFKL